MTARSIKCSENEKKRVHSSIKWHYKVFLHLVLLDLANWSDFSALYELRDKEELNMKSEDLCGQSLTQWGLEGGRRKELPFSAYTSSKGNNIGSSNTNNELTAGVSSPLTTAHSVFLTFAPDRPALRLETGLMGDLS